MIPRDFSQSLSKASDMPAVWNEPAITWQLTQLRDQRPSMLPHFVESVKERFIVNQDDRTAQTRLRFMQSQIEQLNLTKSFRQIGHDLQLMYYQHEKNIKALELETKELEIKADNLTSKQQLEVLREQKKIELEIAQLERDIRAINNPPKPEAKPHPEQDRAQKKAAIETRIATLRKEQSEAVEAIPESLTEQRRKVSNMYADAIEREMDNLRKVL